MMVPTMNYDKLFSTFTDPKGKKNIDYPLKDIYALYIGNKEETIEVAICQKTIDENGNTIYIDLITNNEYDPTHPQEIYPTKFYRQLFLLQPNRQYYQKCVLFYQSKLKLLFVFPSEK